MADQRPAPANQTGGAEASGELRVTWAELFFDLVFVFAVTEVTSAMRGDPTWLGVAHALVVFVPTYWVWVGTCIFANTNSLEPALVKIAVFAIALAGMFLALSVPDAFGDRAMLFAGAYLAARAILAVLVWRGRRMALVTFLVSLTVSGPVLLVGAFLPAPARLAVWGVAAAVDLATPAVSRRRLMRVRIFGAHLAERFGGFLIIALGESIVNIGVPAAAAHHLSDVVVAAVAAAFVLACGLWWVYYGYAASAVLHALATSAIPSDIVRQVLSYGHLLFIGAVITVADGLGTVIAQPTQRLGWGTAGLLFGGAAWYLAAFGYTRWRMFGTVSRTRLTAAGVVVVALPAAAWLPGLAAVCGLAAVVVALNVVENRIVARQSG